MRNWGAKKDFTPTQQYLFLRNNPLCEGTGEVRNGRLIWTYQAQSNPLGRIYTIEIQFMAGSAPTIFVRDPNIQLLAGDRDLPHIYHNPTSLCLYQPKNQQWRPTLRIDQTIVPWTVLWLFFFEEWLESDEWKGEGEHPDPHDGSYSRSTRRLMSR
ncbi:hypothetical protein N9L47_13240 [Rhodobacteraceae bacterium]|nr:hypothetical protein [Paracoccaceae bacterium]